MAWLLIVLWHGVGLDDLGRTLPTPSILSSVSAGDRQEKSHGWVKHWDKLGLSLGHQAGQPGGQGMGTKGLSLGILAL